MDWVISAKRKEGCSSCGEVGYIPIKGSITGLISEGTTVELLCKKCKGDGHTWAEEDLTLESLKELLK